MRTAIHASPVGECFFGCSGTMILYHDFHSNAIKLCRQHSLELVSVDDDSESHWHCQFQWLSCVLCRLTEGLLLRLSSMCSTIKKRLILATTLMGKVNLEWQSHGTRETERSKTMSHIFLTYRCQVLLGLTHSFHLRCVLSFGSSQLLAHFARHMAYSICLSNRTLYLLSLRLLMHALLLIVSPYRCIQWGRMSVHCHICIYCLRRYATY